MIRSLSVVSAVLFLVATSSAVHAEAETVVSLKQLRDGAKGKAKSKWIGKKLRVSGISDGVNSSTQDKKTVTRVKMKLADGSFRLTCRMESAEPGPLPDVGFDQPITFVGTLKDNGTDLEGCTYTLGKAKK